MVFFRVGRLKQSLVVALAVSAMREFSDVSELQRLSRLISTWRKNLCQPASSWDRSNSQRGLTCLPEGSRDGRHAGGQTPRGKTDRKIHNAQVGVFPLSEVFFVLLISS
jgi:hypothetical protein